MNIANLNKNKKKMPFKQLSFILTILLLLFTFSFACSPAVNPRDNNDEQTVFTPSLHIKVSDGSSDITDSLSIAVNNSNLISITGLSNTVTDKTYTLTIAPVTGVFSTQGDSPITITITEPDGFSPGDGVLSPSDSFTITNVSDPNPISYTVVVPFSGTPVEDWFDTSYISASFNSQAASLTLNENTLSVNDLTNAIDGTGSIEITTLPSGFVANPDSITLPDPDGSGTDQNTITLSPNTFTISETDNSTNSQTYTIDTISLAAITVFTPSRHINITDDSITDPTLNYITDTLSIAVNNSNLITITGLSNAVTDKTYTLTIAPVTGVFSTQGDSPITITITEPDGFSPGDGVLSPSDSFTITNDSDSNPINYTLEVPFSGAPVQDWFDTSYISASFASQAASLTLIENTLSVNDLTNAIDGTGSISFTLPTGFVANPESITLPDPDGSGTDQNTITLSLNTFTISETDNSTNSQTYTVNPINLNRLIVFTADEHIVITDDTSSSPVPGLSIGVDENDSTKIIISGLVNSIGADKTYTLTITPVADVFSTLGNSPITITITEPLGFSPGDGSLTPSDSFTITNDSDSSNSISYTVVVPFSGAKVEEWLRPATFSTYFTGATYSGQTLDRGALSFDFGGVSIAINGSSIINLQDGSLELTNNIADGYTLTHNLRDPDGDGVAALTDADAGSITITEDNNPTNTKTYPVTISLAPYTSPLEASHISVTGINGFILDSTIDIQIEQNIITISGVSNGTSGSGSVSITEPPTGEFTVKNNSISLSFDDSDGIFATEGNPVGTVDIVSALGTVSHTVILSLAPYTSPVEVSHVTAMFNGNTAWPINIEISGTNISISGFLNIAGSTGSGSVSITPTTGYIIDPDPLSLSFTDPDGTDSQDIEAGAVSVTSAGLTAIHTIIIRFSTLIELKITSPNVVNSPVTISSGATVTLRDLGACELLPQPTFEIDGTTSATVRGFPSYFDRRKDSINGLAPYIVNRILILEDASGEVLDEYFTVSIEGFPACDDAYIFTNTGNDADPYEIDSVPKLELVSHLVNSDNANYASKSYKLTADIDLGLADIPWSEAASGETGEGFPPIGLTDTKFQGTFDCADYSITGLYINKANGNEAGLFGNALSASIQNCSLINVNVTGFNFVGGLVGSQGASSSITNSYVTGSVSGNASVGGLAGYSFSSSITNSYVSGSVSGNGNKVGGLAGVIGASSSIINSYSTGSIEGTGNEVGGLAGYVNFSSRIENSYANGSVSGNDDVGGLAGYVNSSSITNSYATGSVSGTGANIGGLAGRLNSSSSRTSRITNSYAIASVSGSTEVGGFAGSLDSSSTITNSYWDTVTSRQDTSTGAGVGNAVGKTTTQLQSGSAGVDIFTDWNRLSTIWKFDPDTQYPRLITVACANRQYPTDPSNVPTDCTDL